jgi:hypothetical protein
MSSFRLCRGSIATLLTTSFVAAFAADRFTYR